MNQELTRTIGLNRKELALEVKIMLLGDMLEFRDGSLSQTIQVNIDTIKLNRDAEFEADRKQLANVRSSTLMPELSSKYSAGRFPKLVGIRTKKQSGCAQVIFSIWDSGFSRPLDHIVLTVPVQAGDNSPVPKCPTRVQGGFAALSGALSAAAPPKVDAALHLFEFSSGSSIRTAVVYVDTKVFLNSKADLPVRERGIYSWFLSGTTSLKRYLAGDLVAAVEVGRRAGDYRQAADELTRKIFRSDVDVGDDPAQLALQSLARTASESPSPPIVLARAVLADGHQMYVPLALLGTKGGRLSHRLNIVYPMPRENYDEVGCIDNWTLGIPDAIPDQTTVTIPPGDLSNLKQPPLRSLDKLMSYFDPSRDHGAGAAAAPAIPMTSSKPEALLLLAHHAKGKLWFKGEGKEERMFYDDIRKKFPNGSIAVLAACGTANAEDDNQLMLERLNLKGFDAMVVSPFPVPEDYGRALALAFIHVVNRARAQREGLTLVQIFDGAVDYMVAQQVAGTVPDNARDLQRRVAREKALEFIIIGNHTAKLCVRP